MKHTIKGYITYNKPRHQTAPEVSFSVYRPSKEYQPDMVIVREHSIVVDVPDNFDPRPELIKGLKAQQQKARADFEKLCTDIQRKISELQCLESS